MSRRGRLRLALYFATSAGLALAAAAQSAAPPASPSPVPYAAPSPDAADSEAAAFLAPEPIPLGAGTYWFYRESYTEHLGAVDATQEDETRFEVRGSRAHPFILQTGGFDPAPGPVERGDDWIRLAPWTGEDALPLPFEVGRAARGPDGAPGWKVEAEEDVTVPAGTFKTLRCALRTPTNVSILWIAPSVGVVRETQGEPGRRPEIERVLLRWSAPAQR